MKNQGSLKEFYEDLYPDKHVPFCIRRADGALLLMNNDFRTYSFWKRADGKEFHSPGAIPLKYSYRRLFHDYRVEEGDFVVESWAPIENLFKHPEKYFQEESQIAVNYRKEL